VNERKYKLSEAMLKGCELTGQAFHGFLDNKGRTCALGAAYQGAFGKSPDCEVLSSLFNTYPELREAVTSTSPLFSYLPLDLQSIINRGGLFTLRWAIEEMNDRDRKTREEIAVILEKAGY
jgi:hypothetical protein